MKSSTFLYSIFGICFGFCFPIFSILADILLFKKLDFSFATIISLHFINPLHFVIDTAPFFLGLAFGIAGYKQDKVISYHKKLDISRQKAMEIMQENDNLIREQNRFLDTTVQIRTMELSESNEEMKQVIEELNATLELVNIQKKEIDSKNENITSSIRYAKTIQESILPTKTTLETFFSNYFLIYQPKDIVSGDFYYSKYIKETNKLVFAVVDCTGHGVPGAFISLVVSNLMHEIIKIREIYTPSIILSELNFSFLKIFKKHEDTQKIGNPIGFEMMICVKAYSQNTASNCLQCGSTYRPFYVFRHDTNTLEVIEGNRFFIGIQQTEAYAADKFIDISIELGKKDWLYMLTDGFADQPNANRKKIGSQKIKNILQEIGKETASIQEEKLQSFLAIHSKNTPQRDDITLLAIQI